MDRLTNKAWPNLDPWECCGQDKYCKRDCHEEGGCNNGCIVPRLYRRLAIYEDTGLAPDEIEEQLATYSAVLCDVTNNRMSKTNYTLEAIRSVISDAQAEDCDRCDNTKQLKRYEEAEADGRLIILPVKEGTPLFVDGKIFAPHCKGQVHEVTGWYYSYPMIFKDSRGKHDYVIDPDGIGTSTFLTREEAEAALKGERNETTDL